MNRMISLYPKILLSVGNSCDAQHFQAQSFIELTRIEDFVIVSSAETNSLALTNSYASSVSAESSGLMALSAGNRDGQAGNIAVDFTMGRCCQPLPYAGVREGCTC